MMKDEKILEGLVSFNFITKEEANKIAKQIKFSDNSLEDILLGQNILSEAKYAQFLSKYFGLPTINLENVEIPENVIQLIPYEIAQKFLCVPINKRGRILSIAVADPTDIDLLEDIKFITGCEEEVYVTTKRQINKCINKYYKKGEEIDKLMEKMATEAEVEVVKEAEKVIDLRELEKAVEEAPVVKYVDSLIINAVRSGASDIHIEPYEKMVRVRMRIDGILFEQPSPPLSLKEAIVSRIKVMSNLDLAEHRLPQDGRIKARWEDREIDIRVSTLPTIYGEKVVMRILDKSSLCVDLEKLGFEPTELQKFLKAIKSPYGFILVTGPTGSGKTTTLYSAISKINTPDVNILTVEDPVEYNFQGINQIQVNEKIGLTFANVLRTFLRQDPDIILVGEIRDTETASIAIRAALTGHLVFSTLHTNSAPASISRLLDMGIEPFLVSSSLTLVVAQRLIRKICPKCKEPVNISPEALEKIGIKRDEIGTFTSYRGKGCHECNMGYRGREGIYEVMPITPAIRDLIIKRAPASEIEKVAKEEGMLTLREAAILKFKKGITTLEEVARVTATVE